MVCSLTRTAATEVVNKFASANLRLPESAIGTLHSHAFRALGMPKIATGAELTDWNRDHPTLALQEGEPVDMDDPDYEKMAARGRGEGDRRMELYELCRHRRTPRPWPDEVEGFAKQWEEWKSANGMKDFTDLIVDAEAEIPFPPFMPRVMLADEAQDLSRLEYDLLRKWGAACEALFIVGDGWQALYSWRGSDPSILSDDSVPPERCKVLAQSYRVSKAVHAAAIKWISRHLSTYAPIEYRPTPMEGAVEVMPNDCHLGQPDAIVREARRELDAGKSVMIQATCSYMLPAIIHELRDQGIPFANPWRRRRGDWNPLATRANSVSMAQRLLDFLRPDAATYGPAEGTRAEQEAALMAASMRRENPYTILTGSRGWTDVELHRWTDALKVSEIFQFGMRAHFAKLAETAPDCDTKILDPDDLDMIFKSDSAELLRAWMVDEGLVASVPTSKALTWWESHLLSGKKEAAKFPLTVARKSGAQALMEAPRCFVGTVHSFKGSEADVVIVLPDLSPSGMDEWHGQKVQKDAIARMFYVALTRAREKVLLSHQRVRGCGVPLTDCLS